MNVIVALTAHGAVGYTRISELDGGGVGVVSDVESRLLSSEAASGRVAAAQQANQRWTGGGVSMAQPGGYWPLGDSRLD